METVMADPVGVFARGDTCVCGVCAHLHLGCRKHKTTLLCMPPWLPELGALCVLVCVLVCVGGDGNICQSCCRSIIISSLLWSVSRLTGSNPKRRGRIIRHDKKKSSALRTPNHSRSRPSEFLSRFSWCLHLRKSTGAALKNGTMCVFH